MKLNCIYCSILLGAMILLNGCAPHTNFWTGNCDPGWVPAYPGWNCIEEWKVKPARCPWKETNGKCIPPKESK